jgi:hypothetical protein
MLVEKRTEQRAREVSKNKDLAEGISLKQARNV